MGKVSESIWSSEGVVIPMAEVSHLEKFADSGDHTERIYVIFKHSKANPENGGEMEPCVYLHKNTGSANFIRDWCYYRHELEFETLQDPAEKGGSDA